LPPSHHPWSSRGMAKAAELSTDWLRSAGDFSCAVCERKRLPASEFSKKQVEKALESFRQQTRDIRAGQNGMTSQLFITAVCKKCSEERDAQELEQAEAKAEARRKAIADAEASLGEARRTTVSLSERPFGMAPVKNDGVLGYVIAKTTEGKPAVRAGVRLGWRVAEVSGQPCEGLSLEQVQALLKEAELPAEIAFDALPEGAEFCTACCQVLASPHFSRKMLTKPVDKRRCTACVEAVDAAAADEPEEAAAPAAGASEACPAPSKAAQSKLSGLQQLCAESAREAELVTGLKAVRGGRSGGRGRGRGRR